MRGLTTIWISSSSRIRTFLDTAVHRYLRALVGVFPAKDVVVWTPTEVDAWRDAPQVFITTALREDRTLYER